MATRRVEAREVPDVRGLWIADHRAALKQAPHYDRVLGPILAKLESGEPFVFCLGDCPLSVQRIVDPRTGTRRHRAETEWDVHLCLEPDGSVVQVDPVMADPTHVSHYLRPDGSAV